jgi:hypothetical protein
MGRVVLRKKHWGGNSTPRDGSLILLVRGGAILSTHILLRFVQTRMISQICTEGGGPGGGGAYTTTAFSSPSCHSSEVYTPMRTYEVVKLLEEQSKKIPLRRTPCPRGPRNSARCKFVQIRSISYRLLQIGTDSFRIIIIIHMLMPTQQIVLRI